MALPASGIITMSMVAVELGRAANAAIDLNELAVRTLFGKPSGIISLADGYGKANRTYATLDPANKGSNVTLSNGNLTATVTSARSGLVIATQRRTSGKFYIEVVPRFGNGCAGGFVRDASIPSQLEYDLISVTGLSFASSGYFYINGTGYAGTGPATGIATAVDEVIGLAFDLTPGSQSLTAYTNAGYTSRSSALLDAGYPAIGSVGPGYAPMDVNFGATAFARAVPAGFEPGLFI